MPLGVYIAYPFCAQKCTYCNFASGVFPRQVEPEYREALKAEIQRAIWIDTPDTIYIGGGTPSQMPADELADLLEQVPGRPWAEATIEAAPGTLTKEKIEHWKSSGINRVSLGVQSFSARELARSGRKHTPEIVMQEVSMLRQAGIINVNIDLIAGLPGQSAASWNTSLSWVSAIDPPHVSVYMLEVDEDSRLGQEVLLNGKRYGAPEVPGDDAIAEFYELAVRHLHAMGIERYEISNFARPGFESLHNLKYWRLEPYLGFGVDAHSFDGRLRWQNTDSVAEYVEKGGDACSEPDRAKSSEEKFFVGLRLREGVRIDAEDWRRWNQPIAQFVEQGLLEQLGNRLRLTDQGILYSNEILAEFIEA
jgi:oxygen-independent coproporphyrinogen-3 oxidase